jgi:hypothetical protein
MSSPKDLEENRQERLPEAFAKPARELLEAAEWGLAQLRALPLETVGSRVLHQLFDEIYLDADTIVSDARTAHVDSALHARFVAMRAGLAVDAARRTLEPVGGQVYALAVAAGPSIFKAATELIRLARQQLEH